MRILKIKNKYQVRKMIQGKTYYLFFKNRPTQREIKNALIEKIKIIQAQEQTQAQEQAQEQTQAQEQEQGEKIFINCINDYIKNKINVLSPSTIKGYKNIYKSLFKICPTLKLKNINTDTLQKYINQMAIKNKKSKTIKNHIGLITATLTYNGLYKKFFLKYPKNIKNNPYIPTDQDIKKLNEYLKNTKYYIFFRLCLYGLRVSEILALTINDIKSNGDLIINKAKVENYKGELITKTTKTEKSTRIIKIDKTLTQKILNQGYIFKHTYRQFLKALTDALIKNNIPHLSPHKLRHYIASKMHALKIPSKYIQDYGGWASDNILKNIYTHTIDTEKEKYFKFLNNKINEIIK